jgi:hypothetical protein
VSKLFGRYLVKPTSSAIRDAFDLFPRYGDYQEARRHALKLAWWPDSGDAKSGEVMDLDWEWIKGMKEPRVGELRISDVIGGHDNLRVIFYVARSTISDDPMPRIWTLSVMQKKTAAFSNRDLRIFSGRVKIVVARYYSGRWD